MGLGFVYAILLSWALQPSDTGKGLGFGLAVGAGLLLVLTIANGVHPAIMRDALPDPGAFLLGWSNWAPFQCCSPTPSTARLWATLYSSLSAPAEHKKSGADHVWSAPPFAA